MSKMIRYSVQPRDRIFVKGYGYFFSLKIWIKILVKRKVKTWMVNIVRNVLVILNNLLQMYLKLFQKRVIQKTAEAPGDLIGNKFLIVLQKSQKLKNKIIHKQL